MTEGWRPGLDFPVQRGQWIMRLVNPGEILEIDALIIPSREWPDRKEASDPSWRPIDFGEFVVAIKALC